MPNEHLRIITSLEDKISKPLGSMQARFKSMSQNIGKNWANIHFAIMDTTRAVKGLAKIMHTFGIEASDKAEQLRIRLEALLGSVEEGNKVFEDMTELAGRVPKTYEEIMEAATMLGGVVKNGAKEIEGLMPIIVDLSAATGISVRDTASQMIRMYSAGAAAADMFRERGVLAMLGFKAGVSKTSGETMQQVIKAWSDSDSKFRGASEKLASTWSGLMSMVSDRWFQFRDRIGKAGFFDFMKKEVDSLLKTLDRLEAEGKLQKLVDDISNGMIKIIQFIKTLIKGAAMVVAGWRMLFEFIKYGFANLSAFVYGAWENIIGTFIDAIDRIVNVTSHIPLIGEEIAEKWEGVREKLEGARESSEGMATAFGEMGTEAEDNITQINEGLDTFKEILGGGVQPALNMVNESLEEQKTSIEELSELYATMGESIGEQWEEYADSQMERIEAMREQWAMYQDEKMAKAMENMQTEMEYHRVYADTMKKANESIWIPLQKAKDTFAKGMSTLFMDLINGTANVGDAFKKLGMQMVQILIDWLVQKAINAAFGEAMAAAAVGVASATGAAIASAYASAAAMVSLATMGGNAPPAMAGISATTALAQSLAVPKMAEGGIVTKPTLVMAGEAGDEAIIPLSKMGGGGGETVVNIEINNPVMTESEIGEDLANLVAEAVSDILGKEAERA